MEPEKVHSTGELVILKKFGDHVLCHVASSLLNVVRQAGRQADKNSSLGDFLELSIWYLVTIWLF